MGLDAVTVTLDRPRRIRYDVNALCDLEERFGGVPLLDLLARAGLHMLRGLLWAGLKHEDRRLTETHVGALMQTHADAHGGDYSVLTDAVRRALVQAGVLRDDVPAAPAGNGERQPSAPGAAGDTG